MILRMLESWKIIAISTPILFVIYQSLSKLLPKNVSVFLVTAYASLIGALIMFIIHYVTSSDKSFQLSGKSLHLSIAIGLFIVAGNFLIVKAYTLGAPQSTFTALFYPVLIIFGVMFGLLFWHERLNLMQTLGIVLSILGVVLISYFRK